MSKTATARCPKCGRRTATKAAGKDRWFCHFDKLEFDLADDGTDTDIGYGSPSRRLERKERQKQKRERKRELDRRWPYPAADEGD